MNIIASSIKHQASSIKHQASSIKHSLAAKRMAIALVGVLACGSSSAYAAGELIDIGENKSSKARAISADGKVVGNLDPDFSSQAFRWTADGLLKLEPSDDLLESIAEEQTNRDYLQSTARGVNNDGTVIVGYYKLDFNYDLHAFYWTKEDGITALGGNELTSSEAHGVSADGNVIVGWGKSATTNKRAYRWTRSLASEPFVAQKLDVLERPEGRDQARGVSANGEVVVGWGIFDTDSSQAFRWTAGGGMRGLGYLDGGDRSEAFAANRDGTVVVGWSDSTASSVKEAFRWVKNSGNDEEGTMEGLGVGGGTYSRANAVNDKGDVVVGSFDGGGQLAFRWTQAGGLISVEDWLQEAGVATTGFERLERAYGVSADGNTVLGHGIRNNRKEAFIARVIPPEVPDTGSGIVGLTDLNQSLAQTYAIDSQMASLYSMVFNGAHHSSISEMAVGKGNNCFWATGDFGAHWRQANGKPVIAEVGVCHDFSARGIRAGVGIGAGSANLDLANNGASRLSGQYALAEIDWQIPESDLLLSVLGSYGQWDADLTRGYAIAGTTQSEAETDVDVVGLRARLDWQDAFHLGTVSISPRFAYTVIRSQVDAYQEQGGSAPARFDERTQSAREFRAGLTGKHRLSTKTTLLSHLEAAHRFDSESARMRGSATVLGGSTLNFDRTNPIEQNWLRVGAEVAHQLTPSSRISISGFVASAGEDQDAGMAVSFQQAF